MSYAQIAFLGLVFVAVTATAFFVLGLFARPLAAARVEGLGGKPRAAKAGAGSAWVEHTARLTGPLARLSAPAGGWERSALRLRFMHAGIRHPAAPLAFFGIKTALALGLPLAAWTTLLTTAAQIRPEQSALVVLLAAAVGYYLPNLLLARWVAVRQREVFESFPDALDLMTVCVEAGLGMEAALGRVADEMQHKSPTLSEELHLGIRA